MMKRVFLVATVIMVTASLMINRWQPAKLARGKVELVYVTDENPLRRVQVAGFEDRVPSLKMRMDPANGEAQKVIVQSLAGVGPDLFDNATADGLELYVKSGIAWDITDQLANQGIDVKRETYPGAQGSCVYGDRVFGVPSQMNVSAIVFNKAVFDEERIPYPTAEPTWEALISLAKRLTKRDDKGRTIRWGLMIDVREWMPVAAGYGGTMYRDGGRKCALGDPAVENAVRIMNDLINVHKVTPSPSEMADMANVGGFGGMGRFFSTGRCAMEYAGRYNLINWRKEPGLRIGIVPLPSGPKRRYTTIISQSVLINRYSPRRQEALKYVSYLSSAKFNRQLHASADGLGPFFHKSEIELKGDLRFPDEAYNLVWDSIARRSFPADTSPFISREATMRIWSRHYDQVLLGMKDPGRAVKDVAREVDAEIATNIAKEPSLRNLYDGMETR